MQKIRRNRFDPWPGKIPWSRKRQPTPVFLPGKSHGQRRLVGCSSWGHKELDRMSMHTHTHTHTHTNTHTSTYISWDLPFGTTCLLKLFTMIICFLYRIHANIIAFKKCLFKCTNYLSKNTYLLIFTHLHMNLSSVLFYCLHITENVLD